MRRETFAVLALLTTLPVLAAEPPKTRPRSEAASLCAALFPGPGAGMTPLCVAELQAALKRGTVTLDAARLDDCVQAPPAAAVSRTLMPETPAACRNVLRGRIAAGGRCASSVECGDGLHCRGAGEEKPGVCTAPASVGAACARPADDLAAFTRSVDDPRHEPCAGRCVHGRCVAAKR